MTPESPAQPDTLAPPDIGPLLRLSGIDKNFGPVQALVDITLEVPTGKVTALAGDNGAGKSVLIKCIAGIFAPDDGQIFWESTPVRLNSPHEAAALGIETVYQDLALCDNLDIVQNLFLGRERLRHFLLDEESMEIAARETLSSLAVTTVRSIRQPVASLSGGQRQSVAIAKSVLWNSKLVIMDEPTAALGVAQTEVVLRLIRQLADRGVAVLVVSHNMNDVFHVADRIAVLHLGRLVAVRPVTELDRQIVVDLMTTGLSDRARPELGPSAPAGQPAVAATEAPPDEPMTAVGLPEEATAAVVAADEPTTAAAKRDAVLALNPVITATSLPDYFRAALARVRGGESGVLPVLAGLVLISVLFQSLNPNFLTPGNLVNLLIQGSVFMVLAMGQIFVLLLGEIDLSIGYVGGIGGVIMAELVQESTGWPWWAAIAVGLAACAAIGALQGTIITRLRLPSFVVTLGGQLGWLGVMLIILGSGGVVPINDTVINNVASGNLSPVASWIVMLAIAGAFSAWTWLRDARRRTSGLVAPPASVSALKIAAVLAAGVAIVWLCNTNRGILIEISGVPWVLLVVLGVLAAWTLLLGRTRFGRYIYAIGGNAEAARRGGVNLARIRTLAFMLASFTAGIGGIVYASRLRSVSTSYDGGTLVLYAVAAAVIGGTSLFGGRGKVLHGVLGGLVIAAIDNGMGLQGYSAPAKYVVTALVLVAAVTIDAVARRGRTRS
ncbi:ATP-binding cassette domain-containing protein [Sinomonas sp. JGH33]|uniref:ATP-binding cassette domain-containing protein n=1 Tax=Sinomonas terricola TaxID=3110330 RepID=A0ABU5T711_9MICC|nr:ATP-binding cassette domain-containing protein [Sinomonas sp. JGH33]MEA5455440.1 ATP-binding cassette domain-containing protein [Sinomonas sp. JGH33]